MRKLDGYVITAIALGILLSPVPVLIADKVNEYKEDHQFDDLSNQKKEKAVRNQPYGFLVPLYCDYN